MRLIKVPWLPPGIGAITLSPFVLILNRLSDRKDIIAHEQKHLEQIAAMGRCKWYFKYVFNLAFRKEQERQGYAVQKEVGNA